MAEPLSIIGAIAASQQLISKLVEVVKRLAVAEKEQTSLVLRLNHQAILLQCFSEVINNFHSEFDSDHRTHFDVVINHMQVILRSTRAKMEKFSNKKPSKMLWALAANDLKESEKELFDWSQRLMVAFAFMSMPLKTQFIEKISDVKDSSSSSTWLTGLMANIRMVKGKDIASLDRTDHTAQAQLDEPTPWDNLKPGQIDQLWVDRIKTTSTSRQGNMTMKEVQLEVSRLFAVLKQADSGSNHILAAEHFLLTDDPGYQFAIASSLPNDTCKRQLLSDMLVEPSQHPLDHRIHVAREFITAIAYIHAMGWVHKAVRPNNILMLHNHDDVAFPRGLGHAFLVGFEYARRGTGRSTGSGHWDWKDDMYRHPDRQNKDGVDLETYFSAKHDVYSAGVVLLELGAWTSLSRDCPDLKLAEPDERRRLLLDYSSTIAGTVGSKYAALVRKCIAVDISGMDIQQLLTELQELRI